jgi:hypothetical protein
VCLAGAVESCQWVELESVDEGAEGRVYSIDWDPLLATRVSGSDRDLPIREGVKVNRQTEGSSNFIGPPVPPPDGAGGVHVAIISPGGFQREQNLLGNLHDARVVLHEGHYGCLHRGDGRVESQIDTLLALDDIFAISRHQHREDQPEDNEPPEQRESELTDQALWTARWCEGRTSESAHSRRRCSPEACRCGECVGRGRMNPWLKFP